MKQAKYIDDFASWKEEFSFSIDIKIRFSETDMFGHMNNVSPFIYFEEARIEYFKNVGIFNDLEEQQTIPVVADLQCDYVKQIFFGEIIKLFVKVNSFGNSSLDLHYMALKEDGEVCLTGRGTMVNVDRMTGKALPIPENVKQKFLLVK